jgi:2-keto-3-deoxy-L-rhamnonate aldolase RhmA
VTATLRDRLRGGEPLLGTFVKSPDPAVAEAVAGAGFDVLVADLEHAPLEVRDLAALARCGTPLLARVGPEALPDVGRMLEAGIAGIQLAGVSNAATLERLWRAVRFHPEGTRGLATSHGAAGYGRLAPRDWVAAADDVVVVAQVESRAGVEALPQLLRAGHQPDAWFIGPIDLSCDLGHPGELEHPDVRAAIDAAAAAILGAGARLGVFAGGERAAADWRARGATYVLAGSDLTLLAQRADALVRAWVEEPA